MGCNSSVPAAADLEASVSQLVKQVLEAEHAAMRRTEQELMGEHGLLEKEMTMRGATRKPRRSTRTSAAAGDEAEEEEEDDEVHEELDAAQLTFERTLREAAAAERQAKREVTVTAPTLDRVFNRAHKSNQLFTKSLKLISLEDGVDSERSARQEARTPTRSVGPGKLQRVVAETPPDSARRSGTSMARTPSAPAEFAPARPVSIEAQEPEQPAANIPALAWLVSVINQFQRRACLTPPEGEDAIGSMAAARASRRTNGLPTVLQIKGANGSVAKWAGLYQLQPGRVVQGRPVWKSVGSRGQVLAYSGYSWMIQAEASVGTAAGFVTLQDDCASPDQSGRIWDAVEGGEWRPQPGLRCVEVDPSVLLPPFGIQLEGGTGAAAKWMGTYKLQAGRVVQGRPVWKSVGSRGQVLAYSGYSWMIQAEASVGTAAGSMTLLDDCMSPDQTTAVWDAVEGGEWVPQPKLRGVALPRERFLPPVALRLSFDDDIELLDAQRTLTGTHAPPATCLGHYVMLPGRQVNGKPAWRHTAHRHWFIAHVNGAWYVQRRHRLGTARGVFILDDAIATSPDVSTRRWRMEGGAPAAGVTCLECPRLPASSDSLPLFRDNFTDLLELAGEITARPGRGQSLLDAERDLCLFGDVSPNDLKQAGLPPNACVLSMYSPDQAILARLRLPTANDRRLQGSLGNCWLISGFAAVAEKSNSIKSLCAQVAA